MSSSCRQRCDKGYEERTGSVRRRSNMAIRGLKNGEALSLLVVAIVHFCRYVLYAEGRCGCPTAITSAGGL